ncbi:MAG: PAS domain S-box protein [Ilumatobacter sp.]|nr:PAS domain S-box protein [Ilumatobacter sp.]
MDLLVDMDRQRTSGDYSEPVRVEPHTEVGQIARQYNRVLDAINETTAEREVALVALREKSDALELLQKITAAVNRELHLERAYRIAVAEVCAFTGWPVGHVYAVSADGTTLTPTEIWQLPDEPAFSEFRARTADTRIERGAGLVGGCAVTKQPAQVRLPDPTGWFVRGDAAAAAGLKAGFTFPVLAGEDVVAVLEFFTADPDEQLDTPMLELMASVGTQLGRAVERRRADEARFRTVVDHMPALVMLRDLDGRFLLANRRYEEFYGVAGDAVQGRTLREVRSQFGAPVWLDETEQHDRDVLATNRASEREIEVDVGGRTAVLASIKFPIPGPGGETVALGGIEVDITERKEHEQELASLVRRVETARDEAERATRAKSHFLASVSHELRTPMNAIIGFTRLVSRKTAGRIDDVQHDNLGKVLTSAEHLMMLINDLLDLSRIEAGKLDLHASEVDVGALVDDVVDMLQPLAAARSLSLTARTTGQLPQLTTDGARLRQVLVNLVGNALKFTEHGGVHVEAHRAGDGVELQVLDTGIGIPADHLDRIFDEFEQVETGATRKYGGTGLGLTISNRLAQLLGGTITAESVLGEGSTFTVTMPAHAPASLEQRAG